MKDSLLCSSLRSLSTSIAAASMTFAIALPLLLIGAATAVPAIAQTAHFSGAALTVYSSNAYAIALDSSGNLYIANGAAKKIMKETPSPTGWVETVVDSTLGSVYSLAVDKNGVVYATDSANLRVVKEVPFGSIYIQQSVAINLPVPQVVAVDPNLNVYISLSNQGGSTSSVIRETPSGGGYIQHTVATGLNAPFGLAADSAGNVFITESGNNRVLEESPSASTYVQSIVVTGLNSPTGLTLDANGSVYIADSGNNRIVKESYFFGWTQSTVPTPSLQGPYYVAFDPAGNLYVSDDYSGIGRVLEIAYTGADFGTRQVEKTFFDGIAMMFTFDSAVTLGTNGVRLLTEGGTGYDFANPVTGTCTAGASYTAGQSCTVYGSFSPEAPGTRRGAVTLVNNSGQTIASGFMRGIGQAPQTSFTPGTASFVPYSNNGAVSPYGVALDVYGDVFISDSTGNRILKETRNGNTYTESVIGTGLNSPGGIALDGAGNLYIADTGNNRIEKETYSNGSYVQSDFAIGLNTPQGVAVDPSGNVYIADTFNNRILKESTVNGALLGTVLPIVGLLHPFGVAADASGRVLVADTGNNRGLSIVLHPDGTISETILVTTLSTPYGVAVDALDNAYFADFGTGSVVKETANSDGSYTYSALPTIALAHPYAMAVDSKGNVYVADVGNAQVLVQDYSDPPALQFATTFTGSTSTDSPRTVTLENIGNDTLAFSAVTYPSDFPEAGSVATDCTSSTNLAANTSCTLTVDFSPVYSSALSPPSGALSEAVSVTDNNLNVSNVQQTINVSGAMLAKAEMEAPAPGLTLGASLTFTWTAGAGVTMYQFRLGTTGQGSSDVYNAAHATTTALSTGTISVPTYGVTLYARLYSWINGAWQYNDYTYTESGAPVKAVLTTPAPGSTLTGTSVTFGWTAGGGVTKYEFRLGTTGPGSGDVYNASGTTTLALSSPLITGIPAYGVALYARLYSYINGAWQYNDYTYTESGAPVKAVLSSPAPGSTLTGSSATFTWTAGGGATKYELLLGTTGHGSSNVYNAAGTSTTALTTGVVSGIPTTGGTLYARLYSYINGAWQYNDYTYTEK